MIEVTANLEFYSIYGCIVIAYIVGFFYIASYLIIIILFTRYIIIINLNESKFSYYSIQNEKITLRWHVKLLNWISSEFGVFLSGSVIMGVLVFYHVVVGLIINFECRALDMLTINAYCAIAIYIINASLIILDFLINWRKIIKCRLRDFYIKTDPFFYRISNLGLMLSIALFATIALILGNSNYLTLSIINTLLFHSNLCFNVYIFVIITIINNLTILCRKKKGVKEGFFDTVFADERIYQMLLDFTKNEWSIENTLIKKDILKYKSLLTESERKELATLIIAKYLSGSDSILELNIPNEPKDALLIITKNGRFSLDLFQQVEEVVNQNLQDIWNRFRFSKEYKDYLIKQKALEELMKN